MNVLSANQQLGMIPRDESGIEIKYDSKKINTYKIVKDGDYVIHLRSFQGGFAFSSLDGICSPAYTILRPNSKFLCYSFLKEYFVSSRFIKSLKLVTFGLRDGKSIDVDLWLQTEFRIPSLNEQEKIIVFINTIQKKINIIKDKLNVLKKYKEGILKSLNNKSKNWINIGDFCEIYQPKTITQNSFVNNGKYAVYGANGIIGYYDKYNHEESQVVIGCRGNCGSIHLTKQFSWINGNAMVIKPLNDFKKIKLYYLLQMVNFDKIIEASGVPQITREKMKKVKIPVNINDSVIEILILLDKKIESLQMNVTTLNNLKRQLLNSMFI